MGKVKKYNQTLNLLLIYQEQGEGHMIQLIKLLKSQIRISKARKIKTSLIKKEIKRRSKRLKNS